MKTYRALKAFPHGNSHVAAGAIVNLTDKQATFLIGFVEPVDSIPTAPALAEAPAADADEDGGKKKGVKK